MPRHRVGGTYAPAHPFHVRPHYNKWDMVNRKGKAGLGRGGLSAIIVD